MKRLWVLFAALLLPAIAGATITSTANTAAFTCAGTTGPFPFTFPALNAGALLVIETVPGTDPGVMTVLASNQWTSAPVNNSYANGGNITLVTACPTGYTLIIARSTETTQLTAYTPYMPALYANVESGLDQLTAGRQDSYRARGVHIGAIDGSGTASITDTPLGQYLNLEFPSSTGVDTVPNVLDCALSSNPPAWCNVAITCADIGNPTWCSGSPTSPAQSTVWLANAIKQLPLQVLGDGVSTVHSGKITFGPMAWLHVGQPPTEASPSGSPLFLNGNVTLDCQGGGFIVDGPLGLSDSWIGNGNIPSNVTRHKIENCIFFDAYDAPTTPIVSEQTYPFDYNGHLANTVDWVVGSTSAFVKNSRVLCEGCLNGLIVGFKTNHNPSQITNIADSTHMTTLTLGQNVAPWTETATAAFPITVSNASAGNTQYCESVSLGNVTQWPGQKAVLSGFTNSANNSPTLGFTVVSAALNCFTVNNASGVFESNTTGAMANVVPPMITDAITYTGTVGTPWVVTAPDANGNQTYAGPNINEAYAGFSTDGKQVVLAGFHNAANNGTFDISGSLSGPAGQSLIAVYNPSGVAETGQTEDQSATAIVHLAQMKGDSAAFFMGGDFLGVNSSPNNYEAQWALDNVSTNQTTVGSTAHKFNFAMELGGNNTYIGNAINFHFAGARLAPLFAPGGVSNTGENISFTNGSFGASDYACIFHDGNPEFHMYGVSADYCNHTTHGWKEGNGHMIYGFQPNITWDGGHWESNTPTWYTEWGTSRGFLYASHMVFTSNDANITVPAMFTLRGTRDFIKVGGWYRSDPTLYVTSWTDSPAGIISSFNHEDVYTVGQNIQNLPFKERGIEGNSFNSLSGIITTSLYVQASVGDAITFNPYPGYTTGTTLTAVASGAAGLQFNIGADATATMANIATVANASTDVNLSKNTYSSSGPTLTITPKTPGMLESVTVSDPKSQWVVNAPIVSQPQQAQTPNFVSLQPGVFKNMRTTGVNNLWLIQPVMATGETTTPLCMGRDADTNNAVCAHFSYAADKGTSNYLGWFMQGTGELDSLRIAAGSHVQLPQLANAGCLGTDASTNVVPCGGTVTYTSSHTAAAIDNGKLIIVNCSAPCAVTLPGTQPATTWNAGIISIGSTLATITLGGGDTYNNGASVPVISSYRILWVAADSATATNYIGEAPLAMGTGLTATPTANALTLALSTPVSIANGGTGAVTAGAAALALMGANASGTAATGQDLIGTGAGTATWAYPPRTLYSFCSGTATSSASNLSFPGLGLAFNSGACTTAAGAIQGALMLTSGTLRNLSVRCGTTGVGVSSGVFTVFTVPNTSGTPGATALTLTYGTTTAATVVQDTTHSATYSAGDLVQIRFTTQGSETLANCAVSVQY